tara:strand:- start:61 stop:579 length:519 start_codon:yes stop_codon:yes gene_type:complete
MNKIFLILIIFFLFTNNIKIETFNDYLINNSDSKLKNIINELEDKRPKKLLLSSHKWCANMRFSASIITACLPLTNKNDNNKKYFPISVCCSSDYCEMKDKNNYPKFYYKNMNNNYYYLFKVTKGENGDESKIVQIIEEVKNEEEGIKHITNNQDVYFPPITLKRIEEICSL